MTHRIRRIVRRLDRSANDILDHVEETLEPEKEPRGRKRTRGNNPLFYTSVSPFIQMVRS